MHIYNIYIHIYILHILYMYIWGVYGYMYVDIIKTRHFHRHS